MVRWSKVCEFESHVNCRWGGVNVQRSLHPQYHDLGALEQGIEPPTAPRAPQHKWLSTTPDVCVCVCVCVCACACACVCTLDGLNAEHKFQVSVTILGRMSHNFHFHYIIFNFWLFISQNVTLSLNMTVSQLHLFWRFNFRSFFYHSLYTIVILSQKYICLAVWVFLIFFIVTSYLTIVNICLTVTSCSCLNFISIIMVNEISCLPIWNSNSYFATFKFSSCHTLSLSIFYRISFMQRGGVPLRRWAVFIKSPMGVWRLPWLSGPFRRAATQPKVFRCRRVPLMCHVPNLTDRFPGSVPYGICQNTWSSPFASCTPASTTWAGQRGADETAVPLFFNFWFQGKHMPLMLTDAIVVPSQAH